MSRRSWTPDAGLDQLGAVEEHVSRTAPATAVRHANAKPAALKLSFGAEGMLPMAAGTVVRGLLHRGSVTLIYGPPKSGKSFLATDLALAIASGMASWMGHAIQQPGPILYVACEGHAGFWKRLKAMGERHGWTDADFPDGFILATGRPTLLRSDDDGRTFGPDPSSILAAVDNASARGLAPMAVIIDTVFRSIGAGNVNSSEHMNAYLAALDGIGERNLAVAIIHHETKGGGTPAGSVALIGAADTIVHVWRDKSGNRFWQVEMAKDDAETEPHAFQLEVVSVGEDPEGHAAASCIVVPIEGHATATDTAPRATKNLPDQAKNALRFLADAINAKGQSLPIGLGFPTDRRGVPEATWREECQRRGLSDGGGRAMRDAVKRARDKLQAKGCVASLDGWWWLP